MGTIGHAMLSIPPPGGPNFLLQVGGDAFAGGGELSDSNHSESRTIMFRFLSVCALQERKWIPLTMSCSNNHVFLGLHFVIILMEIHLGIIVPDWDLPLISPYTWVIISNGEIPIVSKAAQGFRGKSITFRPIVTRKICFSQDNYIFFIKKGFPKFTL